MGGVLSEGLLKHGQDSGTRIQFRLVQLPHLDPNVGPDVQVNVSAAVEQVRSATLDPPCNRDGQMKH